jgi:hypothetical protein
VFAGVKPMHLQGASPDREREKESDRKRESGCAASRASCECVSGGSACLAV